MYLKLWQARKTMTMEMRMLAKEISFFSLMLLARLGRIIVNISSNFSS
jgi:hypothetical protein